jgi:hypothetical protein
MADNTQKKTYWPHMILGFLMVGITLGYWTVKSATSMPVQESNDFMMKYQQADIHYNDIIKKKQAFDKKYHIKLTGAETMVMTDNVNSNRAQPNPVKLHQGKNSFTYLISKRDGSGVEDANVTFELTRPHTREDDQTFTNIPGKEGRYTVKDVLITKPGRYTLLLRAQIDDNTVGYSKIPAYLKP